MTQNNQAGPAVRGLSSFVVPVIILVFCGVAYYLTTTFDRVPPILKRGIQPSDFPQLVIGLIAVLSLYLLWRDREPAPAALPRVVYKTLGLILLFPFVSMIDLFLAIGVFGIALMLIWQERRAFALLISGILVPTAIFFLFDLVFEVRFPRGLITNLWYG